jgi:protocatechuate 3,4-dioxygenase beta subunit
MKPVRVHWGVLALSVCLFGVMVPAQQPVMPPGTPPGRPGAIGPPSAPGAPSSEPALVTGRVVDGDTGVPISAAVVSILAAGARETPDTSRILTDTSGRFFFNDIGGGKYTINAEKAGWIPGSVGRNRPGGDAQPIDLRAGETRRDIIIPLWRYAIVSGRVLDDSADPLVGVDVRIFQQGFAAGRRQFSFAARAFTDDRGVYRFSRLLPGDYIVVVPGTVASEPPSFRESVTPPTTYLQTMTSVATAPMSLNRAADATTGADRAFVSSILSLPGLPLADAAWTTFATTFYPSTASQTLATVVRATSGRDRAGTDVTIRFTPTFQVRGSLALPDGAAAAFHAVHLVPVDAGDNVLVNTATAVTDARGDFTFFGVPAGSYIARVVREPAPVAPFRMSTCGGTGAIPYICTYSEGPPSADGIPIPTEDLMVAERAVTVADRHVDVGAMLLTAGARVTGRVEFEGAAIRPAPEALRTMSVVLERADGLVFQQHGSNFPPSEPGRVTAEGQFTLPSLRPGRYVVRVPRAPAGWFFKGASHEGRDVSETAFDLRNTIDGVVITLTDRQQQMQGDVLDANGRPELASNVILFPAEPTARVDYGRTSRRVLSVPVMSGRYTMPAPPPGDYLLVAVAADQMANWQDPVRLERFATIAERVTVTGAGSITRTLRTRRVP